MAPEKTEAEPTIGRLVNDASRDISTLISKEIKLAKSELKLSLRFGVTGVALFVAAGLLAVLAIIMLSVAFAYLIHWNGDGLDLHWAFLIVVGVYLLLAGLLALVGVKKIKRAGPPEKAIEQGRQIPGALKGNTAAELR
jgi:high-affinity Fe2+/Pb2+ permease